MVSSRWRGKRSGSTRKSTPNKKRKSSLSIRRCRSQHLEVSPKLTKVERCCASLATLDLLHAKSALGFLVLEPQEFDRLSPLGAPGRYRLAIGFPGWESSQPSPARNALQNDSRRRIHKSCSCGYTVC